MPENCAKCLKPITGTVVNGMNKTWHPECFVCAGCRVQLSGKQFHNQQGTPYCIDCRKANFDPTCEKCGKKIDSTIKYTIYNNKTYHRDCFVCYQCKQPLEGKKFFIKDGQNYCSEHSK